MSQAWKHLALILLLVPAACAAPERPPARPTRPVPAPPPSPPVSTNPGLAGVIGQTAARLTTLFGRPSLQIEEGYARKLQFANATCVLDAYLYPPAAGREAIVTHVDSRLPDGRDFDAGSCVAALMRREQAP